MQMLARVASFLTVLALAPIAGAAEPDPPLVPEPLPAGQVPKWPAPKERFDGCPVSLRAVRTDGDVVLWGWGAPKGVAELSLAARFVDDKGEVLMAPSFGGGVKPKAGAWYPVIPVETMGKRIAFTKVQALELGCEGRPRPRALQCIAMADGSRGRAPPRQAHHAERAGPSVRARRLTIATCGAVSPPPSKSMNATYTDARGPCPPEPTRRSLGLTSPA